MSRDGKLGVWGLQRATDLRRTSGEALRVPERYGLGLGPAPELYAFLDKVGVLVYGDYLPAESGVWMAFTATQS